MNGQNKLDTTVSAMLDNRNKTAKQEAALRKQRDSLLGKLNVVNQNLLSLLTGKTVKVNGKVGRPKGTGINIAKTITEILGNTDSHNINEIVKAVRESGKLNGVSVASVKASV